MKNKIINNMAKCSEESFKFSVSFLTNTNEALLRRKIMYFFKDNIKKYAKWTVLFHLNIEVVDTKVTIRIFYYKF